MFRFLHIDGAGVSRSVVAGVLLFCVILAFGAEVRFRGIGVESVDLEEYACVGGIQAPTWSAFFSNQRDLYPYGAPLAPALIYFWSRLAGDSIVAIRTLFACISMASLLLCYWLAQAVFRNWSPGERSRAGLAVMLCFALSPVHVFHAQEARMYALVSFFAILSMIGLAEGLQRGGRHWWWLNGIANAGLLASHYFTVFLLPVQGLALLLWERRISRRFLYWSCVQGILLLGLFLWVRSIPRQAEDLYSYYTLPDLATVITHLLARDSTTLAANAFFASSQAWNWLPGAAGAWMRDAHDYFDLALMAVSFFMLSGSAIALLFHLRRKNPVRTWTWATLLLWALLPTALMVAVSWFWQPIYGSRYVTYSGLALYLAVGALVARVRVPGFYPVSLLILLAVFGYQLALAMPPETRTAWRQALELTGEDGGATPVILLEDPFWLPVLALNEDRQKNMPVTAAFERETLCEAASFLHTLCGDDRPVWIILVLTTDFDEEPFSACLLKHALFYERHYFPGERKLALYKIRGAAEQAAQPATAQEAGSSLFMPLAVSLGVENEARNAFAGHVRYMADEQGGFWLRLGLNLASRGDTALAAAVFERAVADVPASAFELVKLAGNCGISLDAVPLMKSVADGRGTGDAACARLGTVLKPAGYERNPDLLEALARAAMEAAPQCAEGYAFAGLALHQREAHQEAVASFRQAYGLNRKVSPEVAEAFGISLAAIGAPEEAIDVYRQGLEDWPDFTWFHMRLGNVYAETGRHAEAVEEFRAALTPATSNDFYIHYLLLQSLLALQRYDEALPVASKACMVERSEFWVQLERWRAFVGAGKHAEAKGVLERLLLTTSDFQDLYDVLYGKPDLEKAKVLLEAARQENSSLVNELALAVTWLEQQSR